jgi:hypothetical protein
MENGSSWDAVLDAFIDTEELSEVEDSLRSIGFAGSISPDIHFRSMGDIPWVLMFSIPVTTFLTAFFGAAGNDAWKGFKGFVTRVQTARRDRRGTIEFRPDSSPQVVIPEGLPDRAYEALCELDFDAFDNGAYILWDSREGKWRDAEQNE